MTPATARRNLTYARVLWALYTAIAFLIALGLTISWLWLIGALSVSLGMALIVGAVLYRQIEDAKADLDAALESDGAK